MVESNFPELHGSSNHEGPWRRCSICNNEFRTSESKEEAIEFLGKYPYMPNRYDELNEIDPASRGNDCCMDCIRKICSGNVMRDMIALFNERKDGIPETEEMIRRSLYLRSRAKTLGDMGLLSHSKGLRPSSFMALGERLFEEKLTTIGESLEFLFQDFPRIEENEFFIREMKGLFDETDSFLSNDLIKAELDDTAEVDLKPRLMIEKMLKGDLESG